MSTTSDNEAQPAAGVSRNRHEHTTRRVDKGKEKANDCPARDEGQSNPPRAKPKGRHYQAKNKARNGSKHAQKTRYAKKWRAIQTSASESICARLGEIDVERQKLKDAREEERAEKERAKEEQEEKAARMTEKSANYFTTYVENGGEVFESFEFGKRRTNFFKPLLVLNLAAGLWLLIVLGKLMEGVMLPGLYIKTSYYGTQVGIGWFIPTYQIILAMLAIAMQFEFWVLRGSHVKSWTWKEVQWDSWTLVWGGTKVEVLELDYATELHNDLEIETRPDKWAVAEVKHPYPIITTVSITSCQATHWLQLWLWPKKDHRVIRQVSLEILSQIMHTDLWCATTRPEDMLAHLTMTSNRCYSVGIDRYKAFHGRNVPSDTAILAYAMWLKWREETAVLPFLNPATL